MALDRYTRDVLIGILITVLTVIVAYAWNQVIVQMIDNYFRNNLERAWIWKIIYLIALTALIVFIIFWILPRIGFSLKQVSRNEQIKNKSGDTMIDDKDDDKNGHGNDDHSLRKDSIRKDSTKKNFVEKNIHQHDILDDGITTML